jgi:hypothetical protein
VVERVTNGGFETGDFTGWDFMNAEVVTNPHGGVYAARLMSEFKISNYFYQGVDLNGVSHITFWHKGNPAYLLLDDTYVEVITGTDTDYTFYSADVSSYTGNTLVAFYTDLDYATPCYIDDISARTDDAWYVGEGTLCFKTCYTTKCGG